MALYALDNVDDALDATRAFLTPVDRTTWVKLALVTLFVSGPGANFGGSQYTAGGNGGGPGTVPLTDLGPRTWLLVAGVVGVVALLAFAFAFVGSVMEFVFVESLRNRTVTVRRYWGRRWRQGARLFGFRLVLALFTLGAVLLFAAPFVLPLLGLDAGVALNGGAWVGLLFVLLPVFVVLAVVVSLVDGFTTAFVVPIMVLEDCGVLDGWRRLWPTIPAQWTQYLAYVVTGFFLSLFGGLLVAVVTAVLAFALLVPFGLLFALGAALFAFVAEPLGIAVLVVFGVLYALAVVAVAALAQAPVQTYLRYYALLVLGDVAPAFDLIPDQRRAVRGGDPEPVV
ncbi:hypothetical protein C474_20576 [Halogeometricum pallidum JCM 14848]|uniref:Glycerophosphoryl diester phosphodiesterase membrane domain-containing protein n=1 Tax=Halogeometricum pallidum JCM 14848 TaxID=1227487 RepID=M0CW83_HALPD|nr:hypothetical protein [Halogeometricum pallidum]ELZ26134.1 hypothetical protein C474_20576 [Halogeometricum pallidum JCM 14848]